MIENERLEYLFRNYFHKTCTEAEHEEFLTLVGDPQYHDHLEVLNNSYAITADKAPLLSEAASGQVWEVIRAAITVPAQQHRTVPGPTNFLRQWGWAVAASIMLLIGAYNYFKTPDPKRAGTSLAKKEMPPETIIQPGTNKAVLTLADGSSIVLDNAANGQLASEGNTQVIKLDDGRLQYHCNTNSSGGVALNTVSTPRGGQYHIILADGTKVWLNAASSLQYPIAFSGNERKVVLTGEAYFEVAKNKLQPFRVVVNDMQVQVLGTHFNIMSYADEADVNTTLLEGAVTVSNKQSARDLLPGQQASLNKAAGKITIAKTDVEKSVAWKNGSFHFEGESIPEVMKEIARWYDVEVVYQGNCSAHFTGIIPRDASIAKVIEMLRVSSELQLQLSNRTITVSPQ